MPRIDGQSSMDVLMNRIGSLVLGFLWTVALFDAAARCNRSSAFEPAARDAVVSSKRIDAEIERSIAKKNGSTSALADDAEFVRRVHLDITGRLPTADRVIEFLASANETKRAKLIDDLLASPAYGENFARYWAELLVKRDGELNKNLKMTEFRTWMALEFNKGTGWDQIVARMLTVDDASPATIFLRANRLNGERPSPAKVVGTVGALFMGVQYQCAECHNHPFNDEWTHEGFWSMAAFFGRTRYENIKDSKTREVRVTEDDQVLEPNSKQKKLKIPVNGEIEIPDPLDAKKIRAIVTAKLMNGEQPPLTEKGPHRPHFAKWLVDSKNPYFARAAVNRTWSIFFAKGFVNPLDDMNAKNPPSHPELLAYLANEFQQSGYDVRHLIRSICNSRAYQRTSRRTADDPDDELFGRRTVQFLHGETLLTALDQVLGVEPPPPPQKGRKEKSAAPSTADLFDSGVYDDDPSNYSFGAPQLLRLMNTDIPRRAPAAIARLMAAEMTKEQSLDRLYLMTLARRPTNDEARAMLEFIDRAETPAKGFEGVVWVLLNSAEFVSNH